jgi:hypothetical protein
MVKVLFAEQGKYDLLLSMIYDSGKVCGFFNSDNSIRQEILDKLHYDNDGNVIIDGYWPEYICKDGGCDKKEFINFQIMVYSFKQLVDDGKIKIDIFYDNKPMKPNLNKNKIRGDGDIIQRIKKAKHQWGVLTINKKKKRKIKCPYKLQEMKNNKTLLCCVCVREDTIILKNA